MRRKTKIVKENLSRRVEVDVSGAVAQTSVPSVFAYSNGKNYSILISSEVKKLALKHFRLFSKEKFHETFYFRLYISGLTTLLSSLQADYDIVLDMELYGQDKKIRNELQKVLRDKINVSFEQIGRKSPAHLLAKGVFLKKVRPNKVVTFSEIKKDWQLPKSKLRFR